MIKEDRNAADRFATPLYGIVEAARYLDVPTPAFDAWARGYGRRRAGRPPVHGAPLLTALHLARRGPKIPFIGLAEGLILAAIRGSGIPIQRMRPALERLNKELGVEHALASKRLVTDGPGLLLDYADQTDDVAAAAAARQLVVVRMGQCVWSQIVESYLRRFEFGDDGYPTLIHLAAYEVANVVADPARGFGQPIFAHGGARLEDALSLFRAGEPLHTVADEFGIPPVQLEDAVRVATRIAA